MSKKKILNNRGEGSFIVLMTALSVIMLAFFILLNSIAVIDDERTRSALGSLIGAFHILPGGYVAGKGLGRDMALPSIPMHEVGHKLNNEVLDFEKKTSADGLGESVSVMSSKKGLIITLSNNVVFESGSAEIKKTGQLLLAGVAKLLRLLPNEVQIEGHTDSIPIQTARYPSNWELSIDRAVAALEYFTELERIKEKRFSISGYADTKPIFNDSSKSWHNRRIEITLLNKKNNRL